MPSYLTILTCCIMLPIFINGDPCRFEDAKGIIDLTSLGNSDGKPAYPDKLPSGSSYKYSYNPCKPFSEPPNCIGVAACQVSLDGLYSFDIGVQNSASWSSGSTGGFPSVSYTSASGEKTTIIQLQCSKDGSKDFEALGEGPANIYKFRLTDVCACWNGCSDQTTTTTDTTTSGTTVTTTSGITDTTTSGTTSVITTPLPQQNCSINGSIYSSDKEIIETFPFLVSINPYNVSSVPPDFSYALVDIYGRVIELTLLNFETIPTALFCLQNLKALSLVNSADLLIPPEILRLVYTLQSFTLINVSRSLIIPPALFSMGRLLQLTIINSGLESVAEEISSLSELIELNLDQNQLINLPVSLGTMKYLTSLSVSNNARLASLDALNGLSSLTILRGSYCSIDHLPINLKNLAQLELDGNQLKSLDGLETITSASTELLSFGKNNIMSISNVALSAVDALEYLNLSDNALTTLPDAIYQIRNLQTLNIHDNNFKQQEIEWIQGLFRLKNTTVIL